MSTNMRTRAGENVGGVLTPGPHQDRTPPGLTPLGCGWHWAGGSVAACLQGSADSGSGQPICYEEDPDDGSTDRLMVVLATSWFDCWVSDELQRRLSAWLRALQRWLITRGFPWPHVFWNFVPCQKHCK